MSTTATTTVEVSLPSGTLYVSGTVNDVAYTWTNTAGNIWQAIVDRAADDIYRVDLTLISDAGTTSTADFTLYYGILNLITDRTQADVDRVKYLNGLWVGGEWTGTDEELSAWESGLKGAYNATDLNRVGAAVDYLAGRFAAFGYDADVSPKRDWTTGDIPCSADMVKYLAEVERLRSRFSVMSTTPETPEDMEQLTYTEANNIEQILVDLDFLLTNITQAWFYSGDLYSGEI